MSSRDTNKQLQHDNLTRIADLATQLCQGEKYLETSIEGVAINRWTHPTPPTSYSHKPSICLIAQGKKRVMLGDETYVYDPEFLLVSSVDLPVMANIIEASEDTPYVGILLELDIREISQLILEMGNTSTGTNQAQTAMALSPLTLQISDAFRRLLELEESPEDIALLAPSIKREIFYRLLKTPEGQQLKQVATNSGHGQQISKAIEWLYDHFAEPLSISELAEFSGMSKSAFHTHFRAMTSMTPLQFQKKLRLNEARRLMLTENLDASQTTYRVGYESPSQFSREYARFFGLPPKKDIDALRKQEMAS